MADFILARVCEMTLTRNEFLRLLPAAIDYAACEVGADGIDSGDAVRGWRIGLERMPDLVLGLIRLERQRVRFEFRGHSTSEIDAFLRRFDLYFSRAGG